MHANLGPLPETRYVIGIESDGYSRDRCTSWPAWDENAIEAERQRCYAMGMAAERERCAKIVDPGQLEPWEARGGVEGLELMRDLAAAIRGA